MLTNLMDYRNHNQSHGGSVHLLYTVSGLLVLKMLIKDLLWFVTSLTLSASFLTLMENRDYL